MEIYTIKELDKIDDWIEKVSAANKFFEWLYEDIQEIKNKARGKFLEVDNTQYKNNNIWLNKILKIVHIWLILITWPLVVYCQTFILQPNIWWNYFNHWFGHWIGHLLFLTSSLFDHLLLLIGFVFGHLFGSLFYHLFGSLFSWTINLIVYLVVYLVVYLILNLVILGHDGIEPPSSYL